MNNQRSTFFSAVDYRKRHIELSPPQFSHFAQQMPGIIPTNTPFPSSAENKRTISISSRLFSSHYYTKDFETRTLSTNISQYTSTRPHASRSQAHYDNFGWRVSLYTDAVTYNAAR